MDILIPNICHMSREKRVLGRQGSQNRYLNDLLKLAFSARAFSQKVIRQLQHMFPLSCHSTPMSHLDHLLSSFFQQRPPYLPSPSHPLRHPSLPGSPPPHLRSPCRSLRPWRVHSRATSPARWDRFPRRGSRRLSICPRTSRFERRRPTGGWLWIVDLLWRGDGVSTGFFIYCFFFLPSSLEMVFVALLRK